MSLLGTGALAIWHNVTDEIRDEFLEWHNREHVPERLGVPGFRCGRRYCALEGQPEYFNLYETENVGVLSSAEYLARLNNPTPWTRRVVPGFRDVARSICRVVGSAGVGQGGVILTQRFAVTPVEAGCVTAEFSERVLPAIASRAGISGAHLCRADEAASAVVTAERSARSTPTLVPAWIVLIEGVGVSAVKSGAEMISTAFADTKQSPAADTAIYRLEICQLSRT